MNEKKDHWEKVYQEKTSDQVSWTQEKPVISLEMIKESKIPKDAAIIDIGGGDSNLADFLLDEGYTNITVLDISDAAIDRLKKRLGSRSQQVKYIVSDVSEFVPEHPYDLWHDRATFHFLTKEEDKRYYINLVKNTVNGGLAIGTFSEKGPDKCSGLPVQQYSDTSLVSVFSPEFTKVECRYQDHQTPFGTIQNFIFCYLKKYESQS